METNEKIHHQGKRKITQGDWCNRRRLQLRLSVTQCCMFFCPRTWKHAILAFCPTILWSNEQRNTSFYLSSVRQRPQENKKINIAVLHVSYGAHDQGVTQGFVTDIESNGLKIIQIHNLEGETFLTLSWCESRYNRFRHTILLGELFDSKWIKLESVIKSRNQLSSNSAIGS